MSYRLMSWGQQPNTNPSPAVWTPSPQTQMAQTPVYPQTTSYQGWQQTTPVWQNPAPVYAPSTYVPSAYTQPTYATPTYAAPATPYTYPAYNTNYASNYSTAGYPYNSAQPTYAAPVPSYANNTQAYAPYTGYPQTFAAPLAPPALPSLRLPAAPPLPPLMPALPPVPRAPYYAAPAYPAMPTAPTYGQQQPTPQPSGPATGTTTKQGNTLPSSGGRATTFWNGHNTYKGQRDAGNSTKGAWGDPLLPTQYFCALPVGLNGGGAWWHNQKILVTNQSTGRQVVVQVQDKGPAPWTGNAIDLSPVAKEALGVNFMDNMNVKIAFADDNAPVGPVR